MTNSASAELSKLKAFLARRKIGFVSAVRAARSPGINYALFVSSDRVGSRADKDHTSQRQMVQLKNEIQKKLGLSVEWIIFHGEQIIAIEAALSKLLQERFPSSINSAFISSPSVSPVWVWIEPIPGAKDLPPLASVTQVCNELLKLFGIESPSVVYADSEELPSNPMILRCIKTLAPASIDAVMNELRRRCLTVPDRRWLHKKLDTMRRNGLLLWLQGDKYVPTQGRP